MAEDSIDAPDRLLEHLADLAGLYAARLALRVGSVLSLPLDLTARSTSSCRKD